MINNLESKNKKELIDIIKIQCDEYKKLLGEQWISVEDRLPAMYEKVLVLSLDCDGEYATSTAHFNGDNGFIGINRVTYDAAYWMPDPKPPEAKQ